MKQGLCFKCEGWGHLAKDCKGKKKDNSSPKKNINDIHAMLMQLTEDEKKGLLGMQQTDEERRGFLKRRTASTSPLLPYLLPSVY